MKEYRQLADLYVGIGMLQNYIAFLHAGALEDDTRHYEEILFALQRNPLPDNGTRNQFTTAIYQFKANHNLYLDKMLELPIKELFLLIIAFLPTNLKESRIRLKQKATVESLWGGNNINVMRTCQDLVHGLHDASMGVPAMLVLGVAGVAYTPPTPARNNGSTDNKRRHEQGGECCDRSKSDRKRSDRRKNNAERRGVNADYQSSGCPTETWLPYLTPEQTMLRRPPVCRRAPF